MSEFEANDWEERLSGALSALEKVQAQFLEGYWQTNGFPSQHSYNGRDETPFPFLDYVTVYGEAIAARSLEGKEFYKKLANGLQPVRSLLRLHPALTKPLKPHGAVEAMQVGIGDGQSYTRVTQIISGLMAQRHYYADTSFLEASKQLNSLLSLGSRHKVSPLESNLDLGFDIDLFHGIKIDKKYELGGGFILAPFDELRDFVEPSWFEDRAPDQVRSRDFELFFGVAAPFRWKAEFRHVNSARPNSRPRDVPLLFHRIAAEFAELLSVVLECPVTWVYDFQGTISKTSSQLLGQIHNRGSFTRGDFVGSSFSSFKKHDFADQDRVDEAIQLFSQKRDTNYPSIAPLLHRLAEAHRTHGRFAKEDRVIDLAIIFERFFPDRKTYKKELGRSISALLAESPAEQEKIKLDVEHIYEVRNALVHGAKEQRDQERLLEIDLALDNGFKLARALLLDALSPTKN